MKSILFLIPTLGGGGAERVLTNIVNNLDPVKYSITIQTLFKAEVNAKYLLPNIKLIEGKLKQFRGNTVALKIFSSKFLYKIIIRKHYDIVVSYLEGSTARIVAGCPYSETKLVSWIHVEQHNMKVAAHSYRSKEEVSSCNEKYDSTICVAESVKQDFMKLFPNVKNCKVIYNTNEDDKIRSLSKESIKENDFTGKINVITVGRLTKAKGFDRLISIHKQLIDEGYDHHIYVLGTGEDEPELRQQIFKKQVGNSFFLMGFQENPYKYIAKADIFVCSSRREGFSTAVTEALILGVPIVTTNCSGAYELCGHNNEYGIVVANNERGIYEGLKHLLSDTEKIKFYKEKAQIRGNYFTKDETVKSVEKLFDNL